ncbi:MAG: 50S ribosomal protein L18 [Candidatus Nitrosocaldaceae archaeon]|nr:MAG: 50S ribosomal protein L18 [Candidatus Nitrosocaldaceae archaeon]
MSILGYINTLKRIREGKTNYRKRKALLIGRHTFATVRISNENLQVQITKPKKDGDQVIVSAHSRELIKYGWKGSRNSLPASYLTGYLIGLKALSKGIESCILYLGNRSFSSRVAAVVKGMLDAGLSIPIDEDAIPSMDRIEGKHIAEYASLLKVDEEAYKRRFSRLLSLGLKPEDYPAHFNEVKNIITERMKGV